MLRAVRAPCMQPRARTCTMAATLVSKVSPSCMSQTVSAGTVVIKSSSEVRLKYQDSESCASQRRTP